MADILFIQKIKAELSAEEKNAEELLKDIWTIFKKHYNLEHKENVMSNDMEQHMVIINGHIKTAEQFIGKGNFRSAKTYLGFANEEAKVIEHFEDVLIGIERKELEERIKAGRESHRLRKSIKRLEKKCPDDSVLAA